jgi:hypothetical protein
LTKNNTSASGIVIADGILFLRFKSTGKSKGLSSRFQTIACVSVRQQKTRVSYK